MPLYHPPGDLQRALECQPRRADRAEAQDGVARRHQPPRDDADGIHAASGRAGTAAAAAPDPFSWGAGTECEAAKGGGAAINGERTSAPRRLRPPACRERKGAHALGAIIEARSWNCDIDIAQCLHCGGQLKLIAAIEEPAAIARILTHLELAAQPPPRAPAVRVDLFQAA